MTDYYKILGVANTANPDDIKKAYRKLASQHHPDKGGDKSKFQEIQEAYATLSDPEKREQHDNPAPQGFNHHSGFPQGFEDIMSHFGGSSPFGDIFGQRRQQPQQPRNRTLNIQTTISLEDAFAGKDLIASLTLPSGKEQMIEVKIPAGVHNGVVLRLANMGDDSIPDSPKGDIHLTILVAPHHKFQREGDDLIMEFNMSCIDAMLGKTIQIDTIDKKTLELTINAGTQHGQLLAAAGYGMPKMNDNRFKGRMLVAITISIPVLTDVQKQVLKENFQ